MTQSGRVIIAGAGPAGLAAARDLSKAGMPVVVFEQAARVGGLARTEVYHGYRFDVGGHRFLTRNPDIQRLWEETLAGEFLRVPRLSRIVYRGRFFDYPVDLANVVRNLGVWESTRIVASYVKARARRSRSEQTFETWVTSRFGRRLYETFFKTYTEKVWGMPCTEIGADWAAQRIRGLTLRTAVAGAIGRRSRVVSLSREFHYPRLGPGQMWEQFAELVEDRGGVVRVGTAVTRLHHDGRRVDRVEVRDGGTESVPAGDVISSLPLATLLTCLDPPPPPDVLAAGRALRHRDFVLVGLILDSPNPFPDTWLYVHERHVLVGRIQNFRNWSADMVPDPGRTSLGMEYFCSVGDATWSRTDRELLELATRELAELGLAPGARVVDGCVIRQEKAYPAYAPGYRAHVEAIRGYLARFENLQTIGRNGTHQYNNQDHAVLAGRLAARNVLGERHDVWAVNADPFYLEAEPAGG